MLRMVVGHSNDVDTSDAIAAAVVDLKGKGPTRTWLLAGRSGPR